MEQEAFFYRRIKDDKVVCGLCPHGCLITPGMRGRCKVRENQDGKLYSLVYGRLVAENVDPVEKKPLFHFLPGSHTFSISTVGCNFRCRHCQNSSISQYPLLHNGSVSGREHTPHEVVERARDNDCQSISYTYGEPAIYYEFAHDCCELAQAQGLKNIFVSNGFMTKEAVRRLAPLLDGINIDIKSFQDDFYRRVCQARLQPVLDAIALFHELGVWLEVTTLIIPGWNDSPAELRDIARFIHSVDPAIPWHVSGFYPSYKMLDRPPTSHAALARARKIGLDQGLAHVYAGNMPGEGGESTSCPACGTELLDRFGYQILRNSLASGGHCPSCGAEIGGVWA
ncbi:MAG: AmmeMemoRadiSam system radical SAM enzyme [Thermodesulfobacteriota bacterium]